MEEVLSNQQARPGDATQLMHAIFSSDDEMMSFYLTLNRFMNPESYLVERTDRKRLEDLASTLCSNVAAFEAIRNYKSISVKEVIRGFGARRPPSPGSRRRSRRRGPSQSNALKLVS